MNKNLKDALRKAAKTLGDFIANTVSTFASILRICILSRISVANNCTRYFELRKNTNCVVLANGPSLCNALNEGIEHIEEADVFCVNLFCKSDYFWVIKPRFYFVIDEEFFNPTCERTRIQVQEMRNAFSKVDWEMFLVTSTSVVNGGILADLNNDNIVLLKMNTTTTEGYKWFRNRIFSMYLGMPRCQTVTNFALMGAINMKYENVYLYGADHSWTKDLIVDDENITCYGDRHVYQTQLSVIKLDYTIGELLHSFANMFDSHWIIKEYADSKDVSIFNYTKGSFIDAYVRKPNIIKNDVI